MDRRGGSQPISSDGHDRSSEPIVADTQPMDSRQRGSLDLSGLLAVMASALAVALVIVATITDQVAPLAAAALAAAVAVVLVLVRRSSDDRRGTNGPHPGEQTDAGIIRDLDEAKRYQAEAVTARTNLLATLRNGFDDDTDPQPGPEASAPDRAVAGPAVTSSGDSANSDPLLDPVTGLFTQSFFETSLPKRVSAARRGLRPLSVAAITVVVGQPADQALTANPTVVAQAMTEVFRDADTIAVTDDGLFIVLLEDTPEAGAVWTLERLRRHLSAQDPGHTMWAGVSCYPAYSFEASGLISQARSALNGARHWQQDRIEIAAHAIE